MRIIKKFFKFILTIIILPTLILIGVILWSYATGNSLKLPAFLSGESSVTASDNFLLNAEIQTADVYLRDSGELSGERGYIEVSKADLASMTPSQYLEFYQNVLKDSSYQWFSVICPDGTGLFIPDCADGAACFCDLDGLGRQTEVHGYLVIQGETCIYQEAAPASTPGAESDTPSETE